MKKPIYYYQDEIPHFDEYNVGPPRRCPVPGHYCPDKVGIIGRTVLSVRYIDCHGHVQLFNIHEGETYEIKAISQTKGTCKFAGRIVDFECATGIEKLISKPHIINVTAIIVDYSDAYESKLIRIGIDNIISIKPIRIFDEVEPGFIPPPEPIPPHHHHCDYEEYMINDPFENH